MSITDTNNKATLEQRVEALEAALETKTARLNAIREIGTALSSTLNLDRLLALIMDKITTLMDADRSTLYLLDEERAELWSKIAQGSDRKEIRVAIGEGMAGWVAQSGQTLNIKDAYKDPRFNQDVDKATGYRTTSMLCQPMRNHRRKIIGVMQVLNKRTGYFTLEDEKLLEALNNQAAISIENSKLYLKVVGKNIELLDTQERLRRRVEEIDLLYSIEKEMNRELRVESILESLVKQACDAIPSQASAILLKDSSSHKLYVHPSPPDNATFKSGDACSSQDVGISATVAQTGEAYLSNTVAGDATHAPILSTALGLHIDNTLCVPITSGDECIGAIQLVNSTARPLQGFTEGDMKLLTVIAGQVMSAVLLARAREEELNESRLSAIGQALSGVLHDLKTPMTIIGCNAQLMVDEDSDEERKVMSKAISRQLGTLKSMTGEILSFARGEANLLIRKLFVSEFMNEVEEVLEQEFANHNITLETQIDYKDDIRADEGKLKRAIYNLARNAREAMPNGGTFSVATSYDEATELVTFSFSDTGAGIPETIRHNLFESFVTQGKTNGTGLGLAIVHKIVDHHKGRIDYDSKAGTGTTFHLRLPRNVSSAKPQER